MEKTTNLQNHVTVLERTLAEEQAANSKSTKETETLYKDIQLLARARDTRICRSGVRRSISERASAILNQSCSSLMEPTPLLAGNIKWSEKLGSGWIDFRKAVDFEKGDIIRIEIGESAKIVKVRLLPVEALPDSTEGILPEEFHVPENRIIRITVPEDRNDISQISVHGGSNPWGMFRLGSNNGNATLKSVRLIRQ